MQALLGDFRRFESQQGFRLCAEIGFKFSVESAGCHFFLLVSGATAKRSIQVYLPCSQIKRYRKTVNYSRIPILTMPPPPASTTQHTLPFFVSSHCPVTR